MKISAEKFWEILFTDEAFRLEDWETKHNGVDCIITPKRFREALEALNQVLAYTTPPRLFGAQDPKARFLKISLLMEKHSRGQVFFEAMMNFPSALFHEWCDLGRQLEDMRFLIDAMWSISSNWARRREKTGYVEVPETDLVRYSEEGEELETVLEQAQSQEANPEEQLLQSEIPTQEQLEQEIKDLFKDKPLVFQILDGWSAEMKGPEIIEVLNIDKNQYQTAARLARRRIKARWPKGMPHVR